MEIRKLRILKCALLDFSEPGQFLRVEIDVFVKIAILVIWPDLQFCEIWVILGKLDLWSCPCDLRLVH